MTAQEQLDTFLVELSDLMLKYEVEIEVEEEDINYNTSVVGVEFTVKQGENGPCAFQTIKTPFESRDIITTIDQKTNEITFN